MKYRVYIHNETVTLWLLSDDGTHLISATMKGRDLRRALTKTPEADPLPFYGLCHKHFGNLGPARRWIKTYKGEHQ